MEKIYIDINCDVGEGVGNEQDLFPLISSCNIACGGHAGDGQTMREVVQLAKSHQVKIGAHPSYPDKANFGRTSIDISAGKLQQSIREQMANIVLVLESESVQLHHIKPHGALYNDVAKDAALARTFLKAIEEYRSTVYLYVPYASIIEKEALQQGFRIKYEAFGDRNYNTDLSLVSRSLPNALIEDPEIVLEHIVFMARNQQVKTLEGHTIKILADTYCIHGDTPTALQILTYLSNELPKHNIFIKK